MFLFVYYTNLLEFCFLYTGTLFFLIRRDIKAIELNARDLVTVRFHFPTKRVDYYTKDCIKNYSNDILYIGSRILIAQIKTLHTSEEIQLDDEIHTNVQQQHLRSIKLVNFSSLSSIPHFEDCDL